MIDYLEMARKEAGELDTSFGKYNEEEYLQFAQPTALTAITYALIALCDRLDALTDEDNQAIRVVAPK